MWEQDIGKLQCNHSYKLSKVTVRMFNNSKYISISQASEITEIDDIGDTCDKLLEMTSEITGEIVTVIRCDNYRSCTNCSSKITEATPTMGQCSKCRAYTKLSKCRRNKTATVIIQSDDDSAQYQATAFGTVLDGITEDVSEEIAIVEKLIASATMTFTIQKSNNTIVSISKTTI